MSLTSLFIALYVWLALVIYLVTWYVRGMVNAFILFVIWHQLLVAYVFTQRLLYIA